MDIGRPMGVWENISCKVLNEGEDVVHFETLDLRKIIQQEVVRKYVFLLDIAIIKTI